MVEVGCSYPFIVLEYAEVLDMWAWKKTIGKVVSIVPVKGLVFWVETPALPKTSRNGTHSLAWRFNADHTLTRLSTNLKANYAEEAQFNMKWIFYFRHESVAAAVTFILCMRNLLPCKDLQKLIGKLIANSYEDECWIRNHTEREPESFAGELYQRGREF